MSKFPPHPAWLQRFLPGLLAFNPGIKGSSHLFHHALDQAVGSLQVLGVAAPQEPGQELSGQRWDSSEQQPLGTVHTPHTTHSSCRTVLQSGNMSAPVPQSNPVTLLPACTACSGLGILALQNFCKPSLGEVSWKTMFLCKKVSLFTKEIFLTRSQRAL